MAFNGYYVSWMKYMGTDDVSLSTAKEPRVETRLAGRNIYALYTDSKATTIVLHLVVWQAVSDASSAD